MNQLQNAEDIKRQEAAALLQKPVTLTIDTPATNWYERLLVKLKRRQEKRIFEIKPLVLGSLIRISERLLSIDKGMLTRERLENKQLLLNLGMELVQRHAYQIAEIAAIAVTNEKKEPPESLIQFFLYQLTPAELMEIFAAVVAQMDIQGFIVSIVSVKGVNVLEIKDAPVKSAGINPQTQGS
jgi:hypothetical protein